MNEQDRINAMISYFFLGPLFLLAKSGTPLSMNYVKGHAKNASKIISFFVLSVIVYFFVKPLVNFSIPGVGIHIHTLILASIVALCLFFLMRGAYSAYRGVEAGAVGNITSDMHIASHEESVIGEEEKVRILASMIPLIGIWIAQKYPSPATVSGRIIGSALLFVYIVSLWITGTESLLSFLILASAILLFVVKGVYIFVYDRSIILDVLEKLPSYRVIHAGTIASLYSLGEFFRIAFGGQDRTSWTTFFEREWSRETNSENLEPYFMPANLLAIPFFNLFGIPSLFIDRYRGYRRLVIEGLLITLLWAYVLFFLRSYSHPLLLLSLFPIVHILSYGVTSLSLRTPGTSLITRLFESFGSMKSHIGEMKKSEESEKFTYEQKI